MSFFNKKTGIAVIAVLAIAAGSAVITHFTGSNPIVNTVRTVCAPFINGAAEAAHFFEDQITFVFEAQSYKEENERLETEVAELKKKNKETAAYQEEVDRLNGLLNLQNSTADYSTVAAKVTGYSQNGLYDKIKLNKGTADGINAGNTVISTDGVVGIISETGVNWSVVDTIIAPKNATGIIFSRTGSIGVIEGDGEFCADRLCKLTFVDNNANIIIGDILETAGTSGIYPPGLSVGTIRDISADNMGKVNYATVEPKVDFSKLYEVLVINGVIQ